MPTVLTFFSSLLLRDKAGRAPDAGASPSHGPCHQHLQGFRCKEILAVLPQHTDRRGELLGPTAFFLQLARRLVCKLPITSSDVFTCYVKKIEVQPGVGLC